jgi:hypothetical protein
MTAPNAPDYSLTVYVAAPGTPHVRDGVTTYSTPGHLYWAISDGNTVNGYGFGPRTPGDIHGPGSVSIRDHREYQNPMYERQMAISREQYEALKEFGRRTIDGDDPRFNSSSITDSYGLGNNCVDYTWKALEVAGIHQQRPYANDDRVSVREVMLGRGAYLRYEGALRPVDNIRDLQRLQDPIQGHPLNQTIEREPPRLEGVDLIRRLLSENDPRHPDHPDHERYRRVEALVHAEDARLGRTPDEASANLTASLTLASKRDGIEPVHLAFSHQDKARGIAAGQNVFLFDGDPVREPWYQRTMLPTAQAVAAPAAESFRELERVNEQISVREQQQAAMLAMQPAVSPEGPGARTL